MKQIYILIAENGEYDSYSWENVCAYENEDDAKEALEQIQEHNSLYNKGIQLGRDLFAQWSNNNPTPVFDQPRPQHDPNLTNDKDHMRKHSARMQEWHSANYRFYESHLRPWNDLAQQMAKDLTVKALAQVFENSSLKVDSFTYDSTYDSSFSLQVMPFQISLMKNEIKL